MRHVSGSSIFLAGTEYRVLRIEYVRVLPSDRDICNRLNKEAGKLIVINTTNLLTQFKKVPLTEVPVLGVYAVDVGM